MENLHFEIDTAQPIGELPAVRTIQNPEVPLTSENILSYFGMSSSTSAGVVVNQNTALTYSPVWQAISMISGDVARMPLEVFRRAPELGESARVKDKQHPAFYGLARMSNSRMHAFKFWRRLMVHALLWNRGFAVIRRPARGPMEFYNLLPDRTSYDEKRDIYVSHIGGQPVGFYPDEILDIEGMAIDGSKELALIKKAREAWGVGLAAQKFKSEFFGKGGHAGGYLEIPAHFTNKAADNLEIGFRKRMSNTDEWFKSVVLREGAKFHQATIDPEKQQLHETVEDQARDVARWFNLAPSRLGVVGSSSYNEKAEDNNGYLDQTLSTHLTSIRTECWCKCLTEEQKQTDSHIVEHNVRSLFSANPKTQADIGEIEMRTGAITVNQYLAATNRNPVPGGDIRTLPMNQYLIDENGKIMTPQTIMGESDSQVEDEPVENDSDLEDSARAILITEITKQANVYINRVKKEANRKTAERFCTWWDESKHQLQSRFVDGIKNQTALLEQIQRAQSGELLKVIRSTGLGEMENQIEQVLSSHEAETVAAGITDICDGWLDYDFSCVLNGVNHE